MGFVRSEKWAQRVGFAAVSKTMAVRVAGAVQEPDPPDMGLLFGVSDLQVFSYFDFEICFARQLRVIFDLLCDQMALHPASRLFPFPERFAPFLPFLSLVSLSLLWLLSPLLLHLSIKRKFDFQMENCLFRCSFRFVFFLRFLVPSFSAFLLSLLLCFFASLLFPAGPLLCFSVFSCFSASLISAFLLFYFFASLLLWFSAFPCFSAFPASLLSAFPCLPAFLLPCFSQFFFGFSNCRSTLRSMIEGSLEAKLPTIWTVEKQRWEESEEKDQKKEDADARKGRKVAKHCVFPMIWGFGGSKSRLAKAAGAEPAGQMRDEKLHAVVARSTFWSQYV